MVLYLTKKLLKVNILPSIFVSYLCCGQASWRDVEQDSADDMLN